MSSDNYSFVACVQSDTFIDTSHTRKIKRKGGREKEKGENLIDKLAVIVYISNVYISKEKLLSY